MPRGEQPLDGDGVLAEFASDLRVLRQGAGAPPYRQLAREAHYSSSTLADAAGGQRLPSLAVTLAYVRACGGQEQEWEGRWHATAAALAADARHSEPVPEDDAECPYVGLAAFTPQDAACFFGRERLTEELASRVGAQRFVAVFGVSGSGKSSLLRAGLLPRLDRRGGNAGRGGRRALFFTPGPRPLDECATRVAAIGGGNASVLSRELRTQARALHLAVLQALAAQEDSAELILVVDQFEEVFTLCSDESERRQFISGLLALAREPTSRARVVLGVRADFLAHCARYPELIEALEERDAQLLLGPMTTDELRRAVTAPATGAGCTVEGALLARIVTDAAGEPNSLPLVSHALRETWHHRRGNTLTLAGYEASGGIHYALARTAETLYQRLTGEQQLLARGILLRLVALGDGTEDTKRRVARDELGGGDTDVVLDALARARLVALDTGAVELAHEALLHAWPRLRQWIGQDRAGLLVHQQLTDAATAWDRERRDPGALYRGDRLAAADGWASHHRDQIPISPRTREFLAASGRHARRTAWLRRASIGALCALTLLASATAGVALRQSADARAERDQAVAGQVLAEAGQLQSTDPSLAAQLTLTAYRMQGTRDAYTDLLNTQNVPLSQLLTGSSSTVYTVAYSPSGRTLASGDANGMLRLWNLSVPTHPTLWCPPIATGAGSVYWAAFNPDERTLATADGDGTVRLWNVTDPSHPSPWGPALTGHSQFVFSVAFSPDGHTLASAGADHTVRLWNVTDPRRPTLLGQPLVSPQAVASATFSPDGHTLAVAGHDNTVRLWNVTDPAHPVLWTAPLTGQTDVVYAVAFSPDGHTMATVAGDHTVWLWNTADPAHPTPIGQPLTGHTDIVYAVAFSPDGRMLATAGADQSVRLWNLSDPANPVALGTPLTGHTGYVYQLAFSPDGHTLASASADQTVRLWDIPRTNLIGHQSYVNAVAFSPNGHLLASGSSDETVELWNVADPAEPVRLTTLATGHTKPIVWLTFSPDSHILATTSRDGTARLWNLADPAHPQSIGQPLDTRSGTIAMAVFSPDGHTLATTGADQTVRLWNITNPANPHLIGQPLTGHTGYVYWVGFSPDGQTLAGAGADDRLLLWNIANPAQPHLEATVNTNTGGVEHAAFSPDENTLATAGLDHTVRLWNITDPTHPTPLGRPLTGHQSWVYWVGFSPDGHTLASSSDDHTLRLWNVTDPDHAAALGQPLTGHTAAIDDSAFSPDGQLIATASDDHTVQLTSLDVNQAITRICATTADTLTPQQWQRYIPEMPYNPPCTPLGQQAK